jgi:hypothetical protein
MGCKRPVTRAGLIFVVAALVRPSSRLSSSTAPLPPPLPWECPARRLDGQGESAEVLAGKHAPNLVAVLDGALDDRSGAAEVVHGLAGEVVAIAEVTDGAAGLAAGEDSRPGD